MASGMEPTKKQLQGTQSDNLRLLWTGTVAGQPHRISRDERYDLRTGRGIIVHAHVWGDWYQTSGGDLITALMEAGKLKF